MDGEPLPGQTAASGGADDAESHALQHPRANPAPAADKRFWQKKILTPVVLAVLGLALFLFALVLYPSTTELLAPASSHVGVTTRFPIENILYDVTQVSSGTAEVQISVGLANPLTLPVASRTANLAMFLPPGVVFRDCAHPACKVLGATFYWTKSVAFGSGKTATADFFVKSHSFGVTFNGVNASAAIPEIFYHSTGTPDLFAAYHFPSASSYDWSSYPAFFASKSTVVWQEAVTNGETVPRSAVGIDHARLASDDNKTFFAGALLGLAGGAILSAVQEALHARD
ncbi:MAG TPA: hypothetical protein VGS19_20295 [Streptosporangiaceae bacterium]|nr:hypothetical protein [Streptosporangiaceae bacterium]